MNDGGSAFPTDAYHKDRQAKGMSIRDWFAGQALAGLIAQAGPPAKDKMNLEDFAEWSYEMADAMIAKRGEQ